MRTWPALHLSGLAAPAADASPGDLLQAALTDHPVAAIEEVSPDEWRVFFATPHERNAAADAVAMLFPALSIALTDVDDGDWAARSQAALRAIRVGEMVVAPPWDTQPASATTRQVIIEPSMGFGTGHHATTRLCLRALQQIVLRGRSAADIGTGSGILAIAASLLGASAVIGIDDDADAIAAARENLRLNPLARVELTVGDVRACAAEEFDVVTANLTGGLLISASSRLERLTRPGGTLIVSGLMASEFDSVVAGFGGCVLTSRTDEDEWVCVIFERKGAI